MTWRNDREGRRRLVSMVENWPWFGKVSILMIAGLATLIASVLTNWALLGIGIKIHPSFSGLSGGLAFLASLPLLWTARPRGRRHLLILSAGVFAATAAAALASALKTHRMSPDTIDFMQQKGVGVLSVTAVIGVWLLVYFLARREGIWGNSPDGRRKY